MCEELGDVWLRADDVGRWPAYDSLASSHRRNEWVAPNGALIDRESLCKLDYDETASAQGAPTPGLELPSVSRHVANVLGHLVTMIARDLEDFDAVSVWRLLGEHRVSEAVQLVRAEIAARGGPDDDYVNAYLDEVELVVQQGGLHLPADWRVG